ARQSLSTRTEAARPADVVADTIHYKLFQAEAFAALIESGPGCRFLLRRGPIPWSGIIPDQTQDRLHLKPYRMRRAVAATSAYRLPVFRRCRCAAFSVL